MAWRCCSRSIPTWTPAQVKSALALTGDPAYTNERKADEVPTLRGGGGVINLPRADTTPIFSSPVAFSFGVIRSNASLTRSVQLTDSGLGGTGPWTVTVEAQNRPPGATVLAPATVTVPGKLDLTVRTTQATDAEATGYVVLTRGTVRLRIPYWFGTGTPALAGVKPAALKKAGDYKSSTKGGSTRVSRYRYPENPVGFGFSPTLPGPERVFRVTLTKPATNFGVVVTSRASGVRVEPRIVRAGDERHLTGYAALPFNLNPYLRTFGELVLAAGTILPAAGSYDVVFDSPSAARAGAFTYRYWVNDVAPPTLALRTPRVKQGGRDRPRRLRPRLRHRPGLDRLPHRRRRALGPVHRRHDPRLHVRPQQGPPRPPRPGLRLPGVAEHGERRPDPAEHPDPADDVRRPLGGCGGTALVAGMRCSLRGKDAGSADSRSYRRD